MSSWLGILALGVPALHALLMGMIGYPLAMRSRGGLARFHRSGFTWWLITLGVVLVLCVTSAPHALAFGNPGHAVGTTAVTIGAVGAAALVGCLAIEAGGSWLRAARQPQGIDRGM